jgi:S1-C subfamily serine protease
MPLGTCPNRDALIDYAVGKLSDDASDPLARHIESCPNCQAELATLPEVEKDGFETHTDSFVVRRGDKKEIDVRLVADRARHAPPTESARHAPRDVVADTLAHEAPSAGDQWRSLVASLAPSMVVIETDGATGTGFVVDATRGLIAANDHLFLAGAKQAAVVFPADEDEMGHPVEGYLAVSPRKDLVLLRIRAGDKQLQALKLADKLPAKGETAFAVWCGSGGYGVRLANGALIVARTVRSGQDISDELANAGLPQLYVNPLYRDRDAARLKTEAAISSQYSGGPLINSGGEVVGINTSQVGDTKVFFCVSATYLKQFICFPRPAQTTTTAAFMSIQPDSGFPAIPSTI